MKKKKTKLNKTRALLEWLVTPVEFGGGKEYKESEEKEVFDRYREIEKKLFMMTEEHLVKELNKELRSIDSMLMRLENETINKKPKKLS